MWKIKNKEGKEKKREKEWRKEKGKNERWQLEGKRQGGGQEKEYKKEKSNSYKHEDVIEHIC